MYRKWLEVVYLWKKSLFKPIVRLWKLNLDNRLLNWYIVWQIKKKMNNNGSYVYLFFIINYCFKVTVKLVHGSNVP